MRVDICSRCGKPNGEGKASLQGHWGRTETVYVGDVRGVGPVRVDITVQPMHAAEGGWIAEGYICSGCRAEVRDRAMELSNLAADVVKARLMHGVPGPFDEKGTAVEVEVSAHVTAPKEAQNGK